MDTTCAGLHEEVCLFDPNATLVFSGGGQVGAIPQSRMNRQEFFADGFFPVYEPAKHGPCSKFPKSPIDVTKNTVVVEAGERIFKSQQQYISDQANCFDFSHSFQRCVTHQHTVNRLSTVGTGEEVVLYATNLADAYEVTESLTLFSISTNTGMFDSHTTSPLDGDALYDELVIEYEDEDTKKRIPNLKNIKPDFLEGLCERKQVDGVFIRGNDIDLKFNKISGDQIPSKDALYLSKQAKRKIQTEEIEAPSKEDFKNKVGPAQTKKMTEHTPLIFSKYGLTENVNFHDWNKRH